MKRTAALILTVLTAFAMSCSALAAGPEDSTEDVVVPPKPAELFPAEIRQTEEDGYRRVEKIYRLSPNDDPANIPTEPFEWEGWRYTILDVTRQDTTESDTRDYAETFTFESSTKDMEKILPQFPATREVATEDGYTGVLTLDTASVKVEAAGYKSSSRTVTATRTYPNLSDTDTSFIPKSITDSGRTLTLADVQWQESGGYFTATATYTGTATSKSATGYTVTAEYAGELTKVTGGETIYTAVFSGAPVQPVKEPNHPDVPDGDTSDGDTADTTDSDVTENPDDPTPPDTPEPDTPEDSGGVNVIWLIIPIAAIIGIGALVGMNLLKKHKSKKEWEDYTK